jgi:hypothetical protein
MIQMRLRHAHPALKNLGMKIAAETPMGAFPLLDYLIVTSKPSPMA